MEILQSVFSAGTGLLGYAIPALFVLTIVVFFHELGHFLVGRWCGVNITAFSIGFGPELFGFNDKYGTRWKFSAIPLGGYVKFEGDENAASVPDQEALDKMGEDKRAGSLHAQPVWARSAIVAAGPFANFLLSIVIFRDYATELWQADRACACRQCGAGKRRGTSRFFAWRYHEID